MRKHFLEVLLQVSISMDMGKVFGVKTVLRLFDNPDKRRETRRYCGLVEVLIFPFAVIVDDVLFFNPPGIAAQYL